MFAFTRNQPLMACWAAMAADVCQSFVRPSAAGARTGHMNSTPYRLIAVNSGGEEALALQLGDRDKVNDIGFAIVLEFDQGERFPVLGSLNSIKS